MEIKIESHAKNISVENKKKDSSVPTPSFKKVLSKKRSASFPKRRDSVFDLASKERKKEEPSEDVSQVHDTPMKVPPLSISKGAEITEVAPIEFSSLVEEIVDYIQIESANGISKTTVKLALNDSVFDGTEIVLDHYDTAPHSFNLQLFGPPEATELFILHLGTLQASLNAHEALKGFHIHLLQPVLSEKSDLYARAKIREEKKRKVQHSGTLKGYLFGQAHLDD